MEVVSYSDFRNSLKKHLDNVTNNNDTLIVPRGDKSVVIISMAEYNSLMETLYLNRSEKNRERLMEAVERDDKGIYELHDLIEDEEEEA